MLQLSLCGLSLDQGWLKTYYILCLFFCGGRAFRGCISALFARVLHGCVVPWLGPCLPRIVVVDIATSSQKIQKGVSEGSNTVVFKHTHLQ